MASASITTASSISSISGYCVVGDFRWGGNSGLSGVYERDIGYAPPHMTSGNVLWCDDPDSGCDTGSMGFSFVMPALGGSSNPSQLALIGAALPNPMNYTGSSYGAMQSVKIRAAVQTNAAVSFNSLVIDFYKGSTKTDSYNAVDSMLPSVDSRVSGDIAESVLAVTPAASDNDNIHVAGTFRFMFDEGTYPDVNDLFAQFFGFAASCVTP